MSSLTIAFTASDAGVVLDGSRTFGDPKELARSSDFKRREPVAWAAADEFVTNATTSGTVTVTAA